MSTEQRAKEDAHLHVENIGGIEEADVRFSPGVTILEGRNATNRTSLLQAVMAVCGSDDVSIKGDADEAYVELTIGGDTYTRTLTQSGDLIKTDGNPFLENSTIPDLFAFLLESNGARRAVARGDDLRDFITRPIDTEEIQADIERLVEKRRNLETQLEEIDSPKPRIPELEEKRASLRDELETKTEKLDEKGAEIESLDADIEGTRETKSEFEERLEELNDKRSALEEARYTLGQNRSGLPR